MLITVTVDGRLIRKFDMFKLMVCLLAESRCERVPDIQYMSFVQVNLL